MYNVLAPTLPSHCLTAHPITFNNRNTRSTLLPSYPPTLPDNRTFVEVLGRRRDCSPGRGDGAGLNSAVNTEWLCWWLSLGPWAGPLRISPNPLESRLRAPSTSTLSGIFSHKRGPTVADSLHLPVCCWPRELHGHGVHAMPSVGRGQAFPNKDVT